MELMSLMILRIFFLMMLRQNLRSFYNDTVEAQIACRRLVNWQNFGPQQLRGLSRNLDFKVLCFRH